MQVEREELATNLVFPGITYMASDSITEQIANRVEYRFSIIVLPFSAGNAAEIV